eukprot:GHUV01009596.1.p1 GENE.GHUV01009596.1~~GHUV01009596.1.p1  ORF type:complete len:597 (+),score=150.72 GHUV01009596.1:329-2119(+)
MLVSPKEQLAGATVLLTGGLGFLGSVCLEQLLRLTEAKRIYVLARSKKGLTATQRLEKLLCSPLFHLLHKDASCGVRNAFSRVEAVEGDLLMPGCGLSDADVARMSHQVTVIIHCAADLTLDARVQDTLRANYCGTRELLSLAAQMPHLTSLVFTSTYYVSNHLPRNSIVKEEIHQLQLTLPGSSSALSHSQFVKCLLTFPRRDADRQAAAVMKQNNFSSTYALGKLLTEQLVNDVGLLGVSKVIVRPSLISALQGQPYPGYVSGYAGAPGWMMGYAAGFFPTKSSMAFASDYILDIIPADVVAALVITAAAAAAEAGTSTTAKVYHAASAVSHPLPVWYGTELMARFWSANSPPFRLPFARYITYTGKHTPTSRGLFIGRLITQLKVWAVCRLLQLTGRRRQARALSNGFKAFCVQNSFRYNKSIVSGVDNVRQLQRSIREDEQSSWQCVWEPHLMDWETYGNTYMTGLRTLLCKNKGDVITCKPHHFKLRHGLPDTAQMQQWMRQTAQQQQQEQHCSQPEQQQIHLNGHTASTALPFNMKASPEAVCPDYDVSIMIEAGSPAGEDDSVCSQNGRTLPGDLTQGCQPLLLESCGL